jgi:hypothetical protein
MIPGLKNFEYKDIDNLIQDENLQLENTLNTLEYQNVLNQTADVINPYAIPAFGNLNKTVPTLATNTYDPYAESSPPDLSSTEGQKIALQNLNNEAYDKNFVTPTITSNARDVNFDRYYNHPLYNELKFHPYVDNESLYNKNSSWWDDAARMSGQFWNLTKTGFVSAYRSLGDLFDDDSYLFGKDLDSAREFSEAMRIGNSTRGGLGGFLNNQLLQAGYTFGIIGSIALEEMILSGLTAASFGAFGGLQAASLAKTGKRILDGVTNSVDVTRAARGASDIVETMRSVDKAKGFWDGIKSGENVFTKILAPETTQALRTLNTAKNTGQNITNLAKIGPFGGFYRDIRSLNYALSESKMEGGMVYDEVFASGLNILEEKNGTLTEQDILEAKEKASRASFFTTLSNAPIIYFSNQLVLGNAFGAYNRSLAKLFNDNISLAAKRIRKTKKSFVDGKLAEDVFEDVGEGLSSTFRRMKAAGVGGTFKGTAGAALRYFSANFTEGAQEVAQEAVAHATKHYYEAIMKDPSADWIKVRDASIGSAINSQFNAQGFETFMSGFLMGGIVQGPQKVLFEKIPNLGQRIFQKEKYEAYKQKKDEYIQNVLTAYNESWNNLGKNPDYFDLSPDKLNYVLQKQVSEDLLQSLDNFSLLNFVDNKDESKFFNIATLLETGGIDYFRSFLTDMKQLDNKELSQAFPVFKVDIKNNKTAERIDSYIDQIDRLETKYNEYQNTMINPYDPSQYEKGSGEYIRELVNYRAYKHARFLALFTGDGIERSVERMQTMFTELETEPLFKGMSAGDLTILSSVDDLAREIAMLKEEVNIIGETDLTPNDKALKKAKEQKIEDLQDIYKLMSEKKKKDGTFDWRNHAKLLKVFEKYVKNLAKQKGAFADKNGIKKALRKIIDYHNLDRRQQLYNNTLDYLLKPKGVEEVTRATAELLFETMRNAKADVAAQNVIELNEKSQFLKQLKAKGVEIDPDQEKLFIETNDTTVISKFYNEKGETLTDQKIKDEIELLKEQYNAAKTQKPATTREDKDEVDLEDLKSQIQFAISNSNVFFTIASQFFDKSSMSYIDYLKSPDGQQFLNAYRVIKELEYNSTPLTPNKLLIWQNDSNFLEFVENNKEAINEQLRPLGFSSADFDLVQKSSQLNFSSNQQPSQSTSKEINKLKEEIEQLDDEIAFGNMTQEEVDKERKRLQDEIDKLKAGEKPEKGKGVDIVEESGKFIIKINGEFLDNIKRYQVYKVGGIHKTRKQAENALSRLKALVDQQEKPLVVIDNKKYEIGTKYQVGKKVMVLVRYKPENKKYKFGLVPENEYSVSKLASEYKNIKNIQNLNPSEIVKQNNSGKPLSKMSIQEFVLLYKNNNIKKEDYEKIIGLLTEEEIAQIELKVVRNKDGGKISEFKIGENAVNPNLRSMKEMFSIGLILPQSARDRISSQLDTSGYDFNEPFAFINNGSTKITNTDGEAVNPFDLSPELLKKLIINYSDAKKDTVEKRYLTQILFANAVLQKMEGQDEATFSMSDPEFKDFNIIVPIFRYYNKGDEAKMFSDLEKNKYVFNGEEYYVFASTETSVGGVETYTLRVFDKEGNDVGITPVGTTSNIKKEIEAEIKSKISFENVLSKQGLISFINFPNGSVRYITLKSQSYETQELDDIFESIIEKAKEVNAAKTDKVGEQTKVSIGIVDAFNKELKQKLFITSSVPKLNFEINVDPKGQIQLKVVQAFIKTVSGKPEIVYETVGNAYYTPSAEQLEKLTPKELRDAAIVKFNEDLKKQKAKIAEKAGIDENQVLKIETKNFRKAFTRLVETNNLVQDIIPALESKLGNPYNNFAFHLSMDQDALTNVKEAQDIVYSRATAAKQEQESDESKKPLLDKAKEVYAQQLGFTDYMHVLRSYNKRVEEKYNKTGIQERYLKIQGEEGLRSFNSLTVEQIKALSKKSPSAKNARKAKTKTTLERQLDGLNQDIKNYTKDIERLKKEKNPYKELISKYIKEREELIKQRDLLEKEILKKKKEGKKTKDNIDKKRQKQNTKIDITFNKGEFEGPFLDNYEFISRGSESTVYKSKDGTHVIKISEPYRSTEEGLYEGRITDALLKELFVDTGLEVIGYYENNGVKNPIYRQKFIEGRTLSEKEAIDFIKTFKGVVQLKDDTTLYYKYKGKLYNISDFSDNVIQDKNGNIFPIDLSIYETVNSKTIAAYDAKIAAPEAEEGGATEGAQNLQDVRLLDILAKVKEEFNKSNTLIDLKSMGVTRNEIDFMINFLKQQNKNLLKKAQETGVAGNVKAIMKQNKKLMKALAGRTNSADKIISDSIENSKGEPLQDFITWLKENLPDFISVESIDSLGDRMKKGGVTVGRFATVLRDIAGGVAVGGVIYTGEGKTYRYHEAFHAVFRLLLTDKEQKKLINIARKEVRAELRKKGKSFEDALEEFASLSEDYTNLLENDKQELIRLYYEEYLADKFEDFKTNPQKTKIDSAAKSIFARFIEWIKTIFSRFRQKRLNDLFSDIDSGKYRSSGYVDNRFTRSALQGVATSADALIPYLQYNNEKGKLQSNFLDVNTSATIVNQILGLIIAKYQTSKDPNVTYESLIDDSINIIEDFYNEDNPQYALFTDILNKATYDSIRSTALEQINDAFENFKEEIKEAVVQRLKTINISQQSIEERFDEAVMEVGLRNTDQFDITAEFKGGFRSLPEFIRIYFGSVLMEAEADLFGNTQFQFQADSENVIIQGEKILVPIDAAAAYNGFLKAVSNTTDHKEILKKILIFSQTNASTRAVARKFFKDIFQDENYSYDNLIAQYEDALDAANNDDINVDFEINLDAVKNKSLFQSVLKGFINFRIEYLFFHEITEKIEGSTNNKYYIYNASNRDDANYQIDLWGDQHSQRYKKLLGNTAFRTKAVEVLDDLQTQLSNPATYLNAKQTRAIAKQLAENLYTYLGIVLSPLYIEYSILSTKNIKDNYMLMQVFKDIDPSLVLNKEAVNAIKTVINNYDSPTRPYLFSENEEGAYGRMENIALGNAEFSESVGASTFLNAEGKLVYGHQLPTYDLIRALDFHGENVDETIEKLKQQLPENSRLFFELNYLLNNKFFRKMMQESSVRISRIAGFKKGTSNKEVRSATDVSKTDEGVTYGSMDAPRLISVLLNAYMAGVSNNDKKTIKKGKLVEADNETAILAPILIRILEASNTGDIAFLPVVKTVELNANGETVITKETKEAFLNNIIAEFNRIQKESNPDTATKEDIVGYNAKLVENTDTMTQDIKRLEPTDEAVDKKVSDGRAFKLAQTGKLLESVLEQDQQSRIVIVPGEAFYKAVSAGKTKIILMNPNAVKNHQTVEENKFTSFTYKKNQINSVTRFLGKVKIDKENNPTVFKTYIEKFAPILSKEKTPGSFEIKYSDSLSYYTKTKSLALFLNGEVAKDIYEIVDDIDYITEEQESVKTTEVAVEGFVEYKGGFENKGKGTPKGDGKDKAMRKVADAFIGETSDASRPSSTLTSHETINKEGVKTQEDITLGYNFEQKNASVVMLARNGSLKGKPLSDITKAYIEEASNDGARFVVGDMPGVDSQFIDYLIEIGAKFSIYHTGKTSRIKLPTKEKVVEPKKKVKKSQEFNKKFEDIVQKLEAQARDTNNAVVNNVEEFKQILSNLGITVDEMLDFIGLRLNAEFANFDQVLNNYSIKNDLSADIKGEFIESATHEKLNLRIAKPTYNLKQIFLNDYLNKTAFMQLYLGDGALSFKDAVDEIKRAKGMNGAIVSAETSIIDKSKGIEETVEKFDLLTLTDRLFESSLSGEIGEATDGQLYLTVKAFRYLWFGIGQLTDSQAKLLNKIEKGEEILPEDVFGALNADGQFIKGYAKRSELINAKKLLYFDGIYGTFLKMSGFVLTKQLTSRKENNRWVAKDNRTTLHNLRERMELHEKQNNTLSIAAYASASKMMKKNLQDINKMMAENANLRATATDQERYATDKEFFTKLRAKFFGLQVVNPSNKEEILDPTQMKVIITAEIPDKVAKQKKYNVIIDGKPMSLYDIKKAYHKSKSDKLKITFTEKRNLIFNLEEAMNELIISEKQKQITPELFAFLKYAKASLESTNSAGNILPFFDITDQGSEMYNLNSRITVDKFMQLFLAYFSKKVLSEKQTGTQITLASDEGLRIFRLVLSVDENGMPDKHIIIRENEFYARYSSRDIALNIDTIDGKVRKKPGDDSNLDTLAELVAQSGGKGVIIVDRLRPSLMEYDKSDPNPDNWTPTGERYAEGLLPSLSSDIYYMYERLRTPENIEQQYKAWLGRQSNEAMVSMLEKGVISREVVYDEEVQGKLKITERGGKILNFTALKKMWAEEYGYGVKNDGTFFDKKSYEEINKAVSKAFSVRIPSQDNHSAINTKFVDFLPIFYGTTGAIAREIILEVSGADFDIDKIFAHLKAMFLEKGEIKEYGKYETEEEGYKQYIRYINEQVGKSGTTYNEALQKYLFKDAEGKQVFAAKKLLTKEQIAEAKNMGLFSGALKAMQILGMPVTFQDYIDFKKKFEQEPYEAALDNKALDYKNALLTNRYMTEPNENGNVISFEPANLRPLQDLFAELATLLPEWHAARVERNIDSNNLYAQFMAFMNNKEGADNIGAIVKPNLVFSLLGQLSIKINANSNAIMNVDGVDYNKFGETIEKYEKALLKKYKQEDPQFKQLRTQYVISALITAMTDNAKERMAKLLGLNKNALAVVGNLISLGMPLKTAILFVINPVIEHTYYLSNRGEVNFAKHISSYIAMINKAYNDFTGQDTGLPLTNVKTQMLIDVINRKTLDQFSTPEKIGDRLSEDSNGEFLNDLIAQKSILVEFLKAQKIQEFTRKVGDIISLTKTLGTNLVELDNIETAVKDLYLEEDPNVFNALYKREDSPIILDAREIFKPTKEENKLFMSTYYSVYRQIYDKLLPLVALQRTEGFTAIYEALVTNANKYMKRDKKIDMSYNLLSYLTIKAYQHWLSKNDQKGYGTLSNDLLYNNDGATDSIVTIVQALRNYEVDGVKIFASNYFLNNYIVLQSRNNVGNKSGQNLLNTNQFSRVNDLQKINLQNSFQELRFYPDNKVQEAAVALVHYMMVSDGLRLKSNSLTSVLLPSVFDNYLESVENVMTAFAQGKIDTGNLQNLYGVETIDVLLEDFINGYFESSYAVFRNTIQDIRFLPEIVTFEGQNVGFNKFKRVKGNDELLNTIKKKEITLDENLYFIEFKSKPGKKTKNKRILDFNLGLDIFYSKTNKDQVIFKSPDDKGIGSVRVAIYNTFQNIKKELGIAEDVKLKDSDKKFIINSSSISPELIQAVKSLGTEEFNLINKMFVEELGHTFPKMRGLAFQNIASPAFILNKGGSPSQLIINPYMQKISAMENTPTGNFPVANNTANNLKKRMKTLSNRGFDSNIIKLGDKNIQEIELKQYLIHRDDITGETKIFKLLEESVKSIKPKGLNTFSTENSKVTGWFAKYTEVKQKGSGNQINGFMFGPNLPTYEKLKEDVEANKQDIDFDIEDAMGGGSLDFMNQFGAVDATKEKVEGNTDTTETEVEDEGINVDDEFDSMFPEFESDNNTEQDKNQLINRVLAEIQSVDLDVLKNKLNLFIDDFDFSSHDTLAQTITEKLTENGNVNENNFDIIKKCLL